MRVCEPLEIKMRVVEFYCLALDVNEVTFCPQDTHYVMGQPHQWHDLCLGFSQTVWLLAASMHCDMDHHSIRSMSDLPESKPMPGFG